MTPVLLHVLLALAGGPRHGYGILGEIAERTGGEFELGPSTLYYSLGRLEDAGLIEPGEAPETPDGGSPGERSGRPRAGRSDTAQPHEAQRRYYALSEQGRKVLEREIGALSRIIAHARTAGVAPGTRE
jgi:DNA-binding PadR family transcriptional regulator